MAASTSASQFALAKKNLDAWAQAREEISVATWGGFAA
jgi:hypothetical protein